MHPTCKSLTTVGLVITGSNNDSSTLKFLCIQSSAIIHDIEHVWQLRRKNDNEAATPAYSSRRLTVNGVAYDRSVLASHAADAAYTPADTRLRAISRVLGNNCIVVYA